jgi:SAM-dependent MidA family methyltransferase
LRDNHTSVSVTEPTDAAALIRAEIERNGPIGFDRFVELALYAPGAGYYVRGRSPFGIHGDFYTAEQLQPVFGTLIGQYVATVHAAMGSPADFCVVELGAGSGEMAAALAGFGYTPVEVLSGGLPAGTIRGVVFANEFFDALPVRVAARRRRTFREMLVASDGDRFRFIEGPPCAGEARAYLRRFYPDAPDGSVVEIHLQALEWLRRIARALRGRLVIIDYGYTAREFVRYGEGTLMSYHRHTASPDVLSDPGNRDITAHVPFSVIEQWVRDLGLDVERFEKLALFLLGVGERDQFAAAIAAADEKEALKRRMQLKTLLYGMGETFRVLVAQSTAQ